MLTFFSGCASLFTHIFNTACGLDFFRFLAAYLVFQVGLGLFLMLYHGTRKPLGPQLAFTLPLPCGGSAATTPARRSRRALFFGPASCSLFFV